MAQICKTGSPLNALASERFSEVSAAEFAQIGVARISVGTALAQLTLLTLMGAAIAIIHDGDFCALRAGLSGAEMAAAVRRDIPNKSG